VLLCAMIIILDLEEMYYILIETIYLLMVF
jgi:hypothetical protein